MRLTLVLLAAAVAVQASPMAMPQGVTAKISPSKPAPPGCEPSYAGGFFGVAVKNVSTSAVAKKKLVSTISDGQPQAPTSAPVVSTISDGQPQAPTSVAPISTISDGQPQAPTTVAPVSTISDGQPQAPTTVAPVSTISDGQPQAPTTAAPVSTISDGQPQAPTATAVSTISDGQPQAPTATAVSTISDGQPQAPTATAVSTISDGQPQAPTKTAVSTISDGQPQAPTATAVRASHDTPIQLVACKTNSTLQISLANGVLTDNRGRTGYIASNYQFQFDKPPQAGAIYTAGWSLCANGTLALGGSNIFYQCLSGSFFNLYNKDWAAQCSPIYIEALTLVNC